MLDRMNVGKALLAGALVTLQVSCSAARADGARPAPIVNTAPANAPASGEAPSTRRAPLDAPRGNIPAPAPSTAGSSARPPQDPARLAWMQGRWVGSADGVEMEEHWTSAEGGALIGMHKDVKSSRMTSFEFMRIEATPSDGLVYFASPRSRPPTPFAAIELGEKRVVFENKAHDFPQRILYWLDVSGALHARIEGTLNGSLESEEWTWTKR